MLCSKYTTVSLSLKHFNATCGYIVQQLALAYRCRCVLLSYEADNTINSDVRNDDDVYDGDDDDDESDDGDHMWFFSYV